ncbi:hypothetical protein EJ04DRAFT_103986 [Polyplosphaeria fusca]|uniref:Uncharacterized protein n=1 Tax=Polyplosphaeria fusca TaxID=682080 RepID=A0A9P4V5U6_9PLEO|nr:hypothetical protein EJ04DRAFT_103986 [Polyplosphaeria fusca]
MQRHEASGTKQVRSVSGLLATVVVGGSIADGQLSSSIGRSEQDANRGGTVSAPLAARWESKSKARRGGDDGDDGDGVMEDAEIGAAEVAKRAILRARVIPLVSHGTQTVTANLIPIFASLDLWI